MSCPYCFRVDGRIPFDRCQKGHAQLCGAKSYLTSWSWICSRPLGHAGPHIACNNCDDHNIRSWPNALVWGDGLLFPESIAKNQPNQRKKR